jgi:NAD(P)-dependent dehydrogenase (short-subunit alcohol dehydrogenase family)
MTAGRLAGKVAVITGAASGIGQASAALFRAEGCLLALVDRTMAPDAGGALILEGDVGDEATVERHAAAAIQRFGRIDILFACAGFSGGTAVPDTTLESWESVLRTNLTGSFLWSRAALGPMRRQGTGSIILVGSQLAFAGGRANAAYLASKGAIVSLAQSMAVDHAAEGVRVNVLVPGAIDTPLLRRAFARAADPAAAEARSVSRHPLGRLGQAEEVARAALFLASDESSFTTGACLRVDGGWLAG